MREIRVHFYKGKGFMGNLISFRTFSAYSHVAIELPAIGKRYESTPFKGVHSLPEESFERGDIVHSIDIPEEKFAKLHFLLEKRVGC